MEGRKENKRRKNDHHVLGVAVLCGGPSRATVATVFGAAKRTLVG